MSSGLRMRNSRNIKIATRNSTDGLALLLYKAIISKTTVVKTIKDDIRLVTPVLQAVMLYQKTNTISVLNKRHLIYHISNCLPSN